MNCISRRWIEQFVGETYVVLCVWSVQDSRQLARSKRRKVRLDFTVFGPGSPSVATRLKTQILRFSGRRDMPRILHSIIPLCLATASRRTPIYHPTPQTSQNDDTAVSPNSSIFLQEH